ncbi:MAG: PQQ-binding-like beta-propeller repeat protein [Bacteroidales bacterium]|nr:PQQ-binding-like beta-propeller repeat protein [Bacteroidales bacterium]
MEPSDNGVSASVCDENFLVITTESCTLYAIDAGTGELAWSKWLGPSLNSTPTVAGGKVYVVYPTQLDQYIIETDNPEMIEKPYAIICFELKTGAILWQNRIDSEPLGSPVAYGNSVYITTSKGYLHRLTIQPGRYIVRLRMEDLPRLQLFPVNLSISHEEALISPGTS